MLDTLPPKGFTRDSDYSKSSDYSYAVGAEVELIRPCMISAIPVGAKGKVVEFSATSVEALLLQRGLGFKIAFDLKPFDIVVHTPDGKKPVGGLEVYVSADLLRPYDPDKHNEYVIMCVGSPLEEHVYAYFRPDDYSDPSWHYTISFGKDRTVHHYYKGVVGEAYLKMLGQDLINGYAEFVPALPSQSLSPFHK